MIEQVPPNDIAERLKGDAAFILLDCREYEEVLLASIKGALHIPMGDIPSRLQELDPEKEYVIFCHHGVRSYRVAQFLRAQDFEDVKNMVGGIDLWSQMVDPSIPRY